MAADDGTNDERLCESTEYAANYCSNYSYFYRRSASISQAITSARMESPSSEEMVVDQKHDAADHDLSLPPVQVPTQDQSDDAHFAPREVEMQPAERSTGSADPERSLSFGEGLEQHSM